MLPRVPSSSSLRRQLNKAPRSRTPPQCLIRDRSSPSPTFSLQPLLPMLLLIERVCWARAWSVDEVREGLTDSVEWAGDGLAGAEEELLHAEERGGCG